MGDVRDDIRSRVRDETASEKGQCERLASRQVDFDDLTTLSSIPPFDKKQSGPVNVDRAALIGDKIGSV